MHKGKASTSQHVYGTMLRKTVGRLYIRVYFHISTEYASQWLNLRFLQVTGFMSIRYVSISYNFAISYGLFFSFSLLFSLFICQN